MLQHLPRRQRLDLEEHLIQTALPLNLAQPRRHPQLENSKEPLQLLLGELVVRGLVPGQLRDLRRPQLLHVIIHDVELDALDLLGHLDKVVEGELVADDAQLVVRRPALEVQRRDDEARHVEGVGEGHGGVAVARHRGRVVVHVEDDDAVRVVGFEGGRGEVFEERAVEDDGPFEGCRGQRCGGVEVVFEGWEDLDAAVGALVS